MPIKLTDLEPRWAADYDILIGDRVVHDADRVGMAISFLCPCCREMRLCVFFKNPVDGKAHTDDRDDAHLWTRTGDTFETLSLTPSVDASGFGHWHGVITNGVAT